ncbi:MAG: maleylpyruvate isomerase N-terminal domain-containing protein [Actinomycetota bacterium]
MGRREELLRAEAEGWEAVIGLVEDLPPDMLERSGVNRDGWTVRDLMWHVAFWCSDAARALGEMAEGTFDRDREPQGPTQVDRVNDRELARSRLMDPRDVRRDLHRYRSAMLEGFGALPELTSDASEWFEESGALHYAEHLPELDAWIRAHGR